MSGSIDPKLKQECFERDDFMCRLCGSRNVNNLDAHHIRFRRNPEADDALWNLISLERQCHDIVHANRILSKNKMQYILWKLVDEPGVTGLQLIRWERKKGNI